ncbi:int domain protein [Shigella boydii 5216-82]|nr:int domain protein [Shigella boydii 5216-82]
MGSFDYAAQFPESPNLKHFGLGKREITIKALSESKRPISDVL